MVLQDDSFLRQARHRPDQLVYALVAGGYLRELAIDLGAAPFDLSSAIDQQADNRLFYLTDAHIIRQGEHGQVE